MIESSTLNKLRLVLFFAIFGVLFAVLFSSTASAASVTYPTGGDSAAGSINPSNIHITASQEGNGIFLNAPYAVVKLKYSADSTTLGVSITDACYWANIDGGSSRPDSCRSGDVSVYICKSDINGVFQSSFKSGSGCTAQDPAGWGGSGQATRSFSFTPSSFGGVDPINGYYNLFVVVQQNTAGLNGFKVGASGGNRVAAGFAATSGGNQPMSLVSLPLSDTGETDITMNFAVPCGNTSGSFNLRWFDADRGAAGIPQDNDIRFGLYNTTVGGSWTSGELAFVSSQSEDNFLGGQGADKDAYIGNSAKLAVAENQTYIWRWAGVNNNNGVQIYVPYDEPDRIQGCPPPSATCTQSATAVLVNQQVTFDTTASTNYSWSGGGAPPTATTKGFTTSWSTAGSKTVTITSTAGTANCVVEVTVSTPPPTASCPTLPNPYITVSLPDRSPADNGVPASTTKRNATHTQYIRDNVTKVTGTEDISPDGGIDVNAVPFDGNYDLRLVSESYQSAVIDYTIFIEECPYDQNQGQVRYESYYNTRAWTADTYDYSTYRCDSGDELDGTTCYNMVTESTPATRTCPSGWVLYGSVCTREGRRTTTGNCTSTGSGAACTMTQPPTYSCPVYWYLSGATCYRTVRGTSYPAYETRYYAYTPDGPSVDAPAITSSEKGVLMEPCLQRQAQVDAVQISSSPTLTPDREAPTSSNMTANFTVRFSVPPAPVPSRARTTMRKASSLNSVPYYVQYNLNGTWQNATPSPSSPRTVNATSRSTNSSGGQSVTASVAVSAPPMRAGDRVCWRLVVQTNNSWRFVSRTGDLRTTSSGANNTAGSFSGTQTAERCSVPVVNWPYLKVMGNDVVVGSSFGCTGATSADIRGFMRNGLFVGGSVQHAVFATDAISGFTSVGLRQGLGTPASYAAPPFGLTFSNNNVPYGGDYSANDGITCLPDYFASIPDSAEDFPSSTLVSEMNNAASNFRSTPNANPAVIEYGTFNGNQQIGSSVGTIPNGFRKVIYVDGTLTIDRNIEYANTSWTNRNEVPYIMFVARNINITPGVTRMDGVYVAQDGAINTCSGVSNANKFNVCRNELVVNGALVAGNIAFNRTRGTLRTSSQGEGRAGVGSGNCDNGTASLNGSAGGAMCAAEVISFSPETYMVLSQILQPEDNFKLDSFINLTPNL